VDPARAAPTEHVGWGKTLARASTLAADQMSAPSSLKTVRLERWEMFAMVAMANPPGQKSCPPDVLCRRGARGSPRFSPSEPTAVAPQDSPGGQYGGDDQTTPVIAESTYPGACSSSPPPPAPGS